MVIYIAFQHCIMSETENLKLSELFVYPVSHEGLLDEISLQSDSPLHDEHPLPAWDILQESFKDIHYMHEQKARHASECYLQNHESTLSEIESFLCAESINRYSTQSSQQCFVVEPAIDIPSIIKAGCSRLVTRDSLSHQAFTQHGDEKPHSCNVCGKTFNFKHNLVTHRSSHYNKSRHACDMCSKNFKTKWHLEQHKLKHGDERPHKCHICNGSFKTKGCFERHKKSQHSDKRPHKCPICNECFKRKDTLLLHKLMHGDERPHKCPICRGSFKTKGNLVRHKLIHDNESPHECDVCNKSFKTKYYLNKHKSIHRDERLPSSTFIIDGSKQFYIL